MALSTDLVGLGMPPEQAALVGAGAVQAVTAAGSAAGDATALRVDQRVVNLTATGADGVIFPSSAPLNVPYLIMNASGSTGIVYPPTGGTINGAASISVPTAKAAIFTRLSSTVWASVLSA